MNVKEETIMKIMKFALIFFMLLYAMSCATTPEKEESFSKNYTVIVVKNFSVSPTSAYPDSAGPALADRLVYWLRYYNSKLKFFDGVVLEGTHEVEQDNILLITGEFKGYSVYYQFFDEPTGTVTKEGEIAWKERNLGYMTILIDRSAHHIAKTVFSAEKDK